MEQNAKNNSAEVPVSEGSGSGLYSSTGIKALLVSRAALVVTSAYLFVRS
jgi:hypothetical protein